MCSVVVLHRPDHDWPVIIGANRDEMADRPWRPPGRHWSDRPNVVAGLDELAGGTWLGLNDEGVFACILNRYGSLGPQAGKRSRGELVLEALDHADAADAAMALGQLDTRAYRTFNLVVADNRDAYLLVHRGDNRGHRPEIQEIPEGLHMVTAFDLDDSADPRIALHLPAFRAAPPPDPDAGAEPALWGGWAERLAGRDWLEGGRGAAGAMDFRLPSGFGTVSSTLVALPAVHRAGTPPVWHFAPGRPSEASWAPVGLG